MRLLYGRHFSARYESISQEIPANAQVIDICAGDCYLYLKYLKKKSVDYLGLDISSRLVAWARQKGVKAQVFDLWEQDPPQGEILVMQASLYQFFPDEKRILDRILERASSKVILSEPVRNLSAGGNKLIYQISKLITRPDSSSHQYQGRRFSYAELLSLIQRYPSLDHQESIPGGKELMAVFCK